jgi:hypothetical protein
MSAKETAEAILIVIKRILKWILYAILMLSVIWGALWALSELYDWYTHDRYLKKIQVAAAFDKNACSAEFPLLLQIENGSSKTVTSVNIYLEVTNEGRSTILNKDYQSFDSDMILKTSEAASSCWKISGKDSPYKSLSGDGMKVKVSRYYVTFEDQ